MQEEWNRIAYEEREGNTMHPNQSGSRRRTDMDHTLGAHGRGSRPEVHEPRNLDRGVAVRIGYDGGLLTRSLVRHNQDFRPSSVPVCDPPPRQFQRSESRCPKRVSAPGRSPTIGGTDDDSQCY